MCAQTRFLPWFLTSFCGSGFNGQFWTDLRLLLAQGTSLVSHVTLRGFRNQLWFPIRVPVSLFSVLRSLSLFADSVLPAFGRRFNLSRSALPTVESPLWHLHCHVERRVLTVGGSFAALCVTPVMNMFLDRGFAIVVFFPAEVHGSVLRVARRSSHLGRWLEGLWGIFEGVRFYPIMNFGHFGAPPPFFKMSGFYPTEIFSNFWAGFVTTHSVIVSCVL